MNEEAVNESSGATLFEQRVLAELAALRKENVMLRLENSAMNVRLTALERAVNEFNVPIDLIVQDLFSTRANVEDLRERVLPPRASHAEYAE